MSMRELRELIELRDLCRTAGSALEGHAGSDLEGHAGSALEGHAGSDLEGHAGSALEGHAGSALEGHAGSALEGHGSVNRQSVASGLHGALLSCPCCVSCVNEERVFCLKALRSSGPQIRPGASDTLEPTMPDVERVRRVPSDDETSDT